MDIVAGGATALGAIIPLEPALVQTPVGDRYLIKGAAEQPMRAVKELFADQMGPEIGRAGSDRVSGRLVGGVRISEAAVAL